MPQKQFYWIQRRLPLLGVILDAERGFQFLDSCFYGTFLWACWGRPQEFVAAAEYHDPPPQYSNFLRFGRFLERYV